MGLGGARRDRTADLLHAMQALSQLSYSPVEGGTLRTSAHRVKDTLPFHKPDNKQQVGRFLASPTGLLKNQPAAARFSTSSIA